MKNFLRKIFLSLSPCNRHLLKTCGKWRNYLSLLLPQCFQLSTIILSHKEIFNACNAKKLSKSSTADLLYDMKSAADGFLKT